MLSTEQDTTLFESLEFDMELPCEVPQRGGGGTPKCFGEVAHYIGWRNNCCAASPRYLLLCDFCTKTYRAWIAQGARIECADCGTETGGFFTIEPLNKNRRA